MATSSLQKNIDKYIETIEGDYWRETIHSLGINPNDYSDVESYINANIQEFKDSFDVDLEKSLFEEKFGKIKKKDLVEFEEYFKENIPIILDFIDNLKFVYNNK